MASIGKYDAMCLHVVTAWRMLFVVDTRAFHVLVHRQCPKFKAWWWWCVGQEGREEVWKEVREVGLHLSPVCSKFGMDACLVQVLVRTDHAACHCQHTKLAKVNFEKSNLLHWSVHGQFWPDIVCEAVAARFVLERRMGKGG